MTTVIAPPQQRTIYRTTGHGLGSLAFVAGLLLPIKAARLDIAGLSLYLAYLVAAAVWIVSLRLTLHTFQRWFALPMLVILLFAMYAVYRGAGIASPAITVGKYAIAFATAAAFVPLLRSAERQLFNGLLAGMALSVLYMIYQWISSVFFGFGLPFTSSVALRIGYGLSQRYGLARVTGFTEEPSFIATLLVGGVLLGIAHGKRAQRRRYSAAIVAIGGVGLALCTSNNLFATTMILASFWPLVRRQRIAIVLCTYYAVALIVTPLVLLRDVTYYSRFSAYSIFLTDGLFTKLLGRGVGSYPAFYSANPIAFQGQAVESLASVWGGFLFEGGLVLVALVVLWLNNLIRGSRWREGLALFALLLMLSNYNSPWWPMVCLAIAQCVYFRRKDEMWNPNSTSADSQQRFGVRAGYSSPPG